MSQPNFLIEVGNQGDLSEKIRKRLISLTHTDIAGARSDNLEIILDDRTPAIKLPEKGSKIRFSVGYGDDLHFKGSYIHDATNLTGPPQRVGFSAMSLNVKDAFFSEKVRVFQNKTLAEIVEQIAAEQGYSPAIDPHYQSVTYEWLNQHGESDAVFLQRLAVENDAVFKAAGQTLIFSRRGLQKDASIRNKLGQFTIRPDQNIKNWHIVEEDQSPFDKVIARWHNPDTSITVEETAGTGNKIRYLPHVYANQSEAQNAARAELRRTQRKARTGRMSLVGRGDLRSEGELILEGWRDGINGSYILTKVVNRIGESYTTEIEFELAV